MKPIVDVNSRCTYNQFLGLIKNFLILDETLIKIKTSQIDKITFQLLQNHSERYLNMLKNYNVKN